MEDVIKINAIIEPVCPLFNPEGCWIGDITSELQLNDVRLQIKKAKLEGYYKNLILLF